MTRAGDRAGAAGDGAPRPGTRGRPFGVAEVNKAGREILEADLSSIYLVGEISNFKPHTSGHWYFSLKDERAQIGAAMFRYANGLVRFRPADGMKVLVRGTVTLYEPRGSYQIVVETMEPKGLGELQAAFEQLKAKLRAEGLFDDARKRPIPPLPRSIGVVTSPTGAAVRDILRVFERRGADLRVLIAPCRVQGTAAAGEIVRALSILNERADTEIVILARGGGSLEDLWPFNEEAVARAIAASRIPVVSAVGHEVDFTIADFVADLRAPTPSAAAEIVLKSRDELTARVGGARNALGRSARLILSQARGRIARLGSDRALGSVESRLREALQRADDLSLRLHRAMTNRLVTLRAAVDLKSQRLSPRGLRASVSARRERLGATSGLAERAVRGRVEAARQKLGRAASMLQTLSPLGVLERGYAICHDAASGDVITEAQPAQVGLAVRVRLHRGSLLCDVKKAETAGG
ncbi:MAG TPA: exodeoxyribonuclease VII large subunit [Verrucomicrobiae bacterium]|nr:exodeoxyribonuclease VII large subunit [Verrucomicrobiae bacterium]